tara:strand:+ start:312 stop:1178 length:867 start_codon:yes stop_codon:yes gene_type:complete
MAYTLTSLRDAIKSYTENAETTFLSNIENFIKSAEERVLVNVALEDFRKNSTSSVTSADSYIAVPTDYLSSFSFSVTSSNTKSFLLQKDVNFLQEAYPLSTTTGKPLYYGRFDVDNFILAPTPDANYVCQLHYYYRPTSLADGVITISFASGGNSYGIGETIANASTLAQATVTATVKTISNTSITTTVPLDGTFTSNTTLYGLTTGNQLQNTNVSLDTATTWISSNAPNAILYGSLFEAYTYMKGEPDLLGLYDKRFLESLGRLKDLAEARENKDSYTEGLPQRMQT